MANMIILRKLFKIGVWLLFLILLLSTLLLAERKKAVSPAPPEAQKEFDQNEPRATSSGNLFSSPMAPSRERTGYTNPLIPPPLNIQEEPGTGG